MGVAQNEDMIQALAADGADDALDEGILPGGARGDTGLADSQPLSPMRKLVAVDGVSIPEQVRRRGVLRKGLDELSGRPRGRGMVGHVEMEELAAIVAEGNEDEQQPEGQGRDEEEVGSRRCAQLYCWLLKSL